MQTLNAELLAGNSATLVLERWCQQHALATPPVLVAQKIAGAAAAASDGQRRHLLVAAAEPLRYRRVELRCGPQLLSVADNWYVPGRLTPEMNRLLEATETPFGRVVLPLQPRREVLSAALLWLPLPKGWESSAPQRSAGRFSGRLEIPSALFEHRAIVYTGDHLPIAEVREVYQRGILAFPEPRLR